MTITLRSSAKAVPAQATPTEPPATVATWEATTLPREAIADLAYWLKIGPQYTDKRRARAVSADRLLTWLETFSGTTWQQRWISSQAERAGRRWFETPTQFTVDTGHGRGPTT